MGKVLLHEGCCTSLGGDAGHGSRPAEDMLCGGSAVMLLWPAQHVLARVLSAQHDTHSEAIALTMNQSKLSFDKLFASAGLCHRGTG